MQRTQNVHSAHAAYLVALQTARLGAVRTEVRVLQSLATDVALEEFVQALLRGEKDTQEKGYIPHVRTCIHSEFVLYPCINGSW